MFNKDVGKEINKKYSSNLKVRKYLISSLNRTSVVSGEYGFVKALEKKKELIKEWVVDKDPRIKKFVKDFKVFQISKLDMRKRGQIEILLEENYSPCGAALRGDLLQAGGAGCLKV